MSNKPVNLIKKLYILEFEGVLKVDPNHHVLLANAMFTYNREEQDILIVKTLKSDLED